jgi:hypothetical protein
MNFAMFPRVFSGGDSRDTTTAPEIKARVPHKPLGPEKGVFIVLLESFLRKALLPLSPLFGKISNVQAGSKSAIFI